MTGSVVDLEVGTVETARATEAVRAASVTNSFLRMTLPYQPLAGPFYRKRNNVTGRP